MSIDELVYSGSSLYDFVNGIALEHNGITSEDGKAEVSSQIVKDVELAQKQLEELQGLSEEEKQQRAAEFNREIQKALDELPTEEEAEQRNAAIHKMWIELSQWNPYHYELKHYKILALQRLESMKIAPLPDVFKTKTTEEWFTDAITRATELVQRQIARYQNEVRKVNQINHHLNDLRESLHAGN